MPMRSRRRADTQTSRFDEAQYIFIRRVVRQMSEPDLPPAPRKKCILSKYDYLEEMISSLVGSELNRVLLKINELLGLSIFVSFFELFYLYYVYLHRCCKC